MLWQFRRELLEKLAKDNEIVLSMPFVGHEGNFKACGYTCVENTYLDRRSINPIKDIQLYKYYKRLILEVKPDMVITYSIKPNIYAGYVCVQLNIPYYINVQGLGTAFKKKGIVNLVTVMYKKAIKNAKVVFFENTANADEFISRHIVTRSQVAVLNGAGVNLDYFKYEPYPSEENGINFLFLGRIMKEKGIDEYFAAARRMKQEYGNKVHFNLVGFYEDEYKDEVEQLQSEGIINYLGFQEDPRPYYAVSHCVVLPSYHEGMSNVLLEAAATGRAIITTDVPGCREAVTNGKTGFIVDVKNKESLYNAMKSFVSMPTETRKQFGEKGRTYMKGLFDKSNVINCTLERILWTNH